MSKNRRILVEILAPPFLAAVWLTIFSSHEAEQFTEILAEFFIGFPVMVMFAYIFGIIPAIIYAIAMELWFHWSLLGRFGLFCTAGWSGSLGALAGYFSAAIGSGLGFLIPLDCYYFMYRGAAIGLLVGFYVGRKQASVA